MNFRTTRTGSYRIGFRRRWSDWQQDLPALIAWARENGFGSLDLGRDADVSAPAVLDAGLEIGSADLGSRDDWRKLLSADPDRRGRTVEEVGRHVAACTRHGIRNFFCVLVPEDPSLERRKNLDHAIESFLALEPVLRAGGALRAGFLERVTAEMQAGGVTDSFASLREAERAKVQTGGRVATTARLELRIAQAKLGMRRVLTHVRPG